jgi:hypothetical protein
MLRSILSVLAGFAAIAALIMPTTILSARLMLGTRSREDMMKMKPTPAFTAVNLAFSAAFGVLGGFLTAWIAGHAPLKHAGALAGLMFVMGIFTFLQNLKMKTSEGRGYSGTLVILGPACALLGGWLQSSST